MPDLLWAPWRLEYIEKATPTGGCIFVDLPKQEDDRQNLILYRGQNAFVILITGERRFYGDFIFKKGVVPPE